MCQMLQLIDHLNSVSYLSGCYYETKFYLFSKTNFIQVCAAIAFNYSRGCVCYFTIYTTECTHTPVKLSILCNNLRKFHLTLYIDLDRSFLIVHIFCKHCIAQVITARCVFSVQSNDGTDIIYVVLQIKHFNLQLKL